MPNPAKIAVIAHALRSAGGLSVGRYLIDGITRVVPENNYLFLIPEGLGYEELCERVPNAEIHALPAVNFAKRIWQDRVRTPKLIKSFAPDVILALDSSLGMVKPPSPQAIVFYAAQLLYPESHFGPRTFKDKVRHKYLKRHFTKELKATQLVFCQTAVMANRLREIYGFQGKTVVAGPSVPDSMRQIPTDEPAPAAFNGHENRLKLFCPARYYPHKNLEILIELFSKFADELKNVSVFITLTAEQHPNAGKLLSEISRLNLENNIINLSHIPYEQIGGYYRNADALFMPSLLESFSTTYVEAMAAGLPILTSDLDFARGACGEVADYFDPFSAESVKDVILAFGSDKSRQQELAQLGEKMMQNDVTSWDEIATRVINELSKISR
ncbi:MAG: glycosyltransferase [Chloroflexi bacterium]|nr:glycosyltransferase [Chloroflexota bacterium]